MLTSFYLAKNDHRWASCISLKTIKQHDCFSSLLLRFSSKLRRIENYWRAILRNCDEISDFVGGRLQKCTELYETIVESLMNCELSVEDY